ncbi:MAG: CHC2 zinc finger domain-containing protein [Chloroflexota bacterium]
MTPETDLITLIEHDLGQGRKSGRWVLFHCPFPGHAHGDRKPSLAVTNGDGKRGPGWRCFTCGRHGGAIRWYMDYRRMSYRDACDALKLPPPQADRPRPEPPIIPPENPPCDAWQARAWELVERAESILWGEGGKDALAWLRARGLHDETICFARLGYIPFDFKSDPKAWGTPNDDPKPMWFSEGMLIPGQIGKTIWYLKMRPSHPREGQKYKHVRGGRQALYMADTLAPNLPAVFCEGELDALLMLQEARGLVNVVTLASATGNLNLATWGIYLLRPSRFILAHDMDEAGEKGAAKLAWLHNSQRLQIPGAKDLTDFHVNGGNLRGLVEAALVAGNP